MAFDAIQRSMAGGEIAPALAARADVAKYATALRTCRNMIVQRYGGVTNRAGNEFVTETKTSASKSRLIPFIFNDEQTFVLEFGDGYIRFIQNGEVVLGEAWQECDHTDSTPNSVTAVAHGFVTGDTIEIDDLDDTVIDGEYVITVVDADHFTLNGTTGPGSTTLLNVRCRRTANADGSPLPPYEIDSPYAAADVFGIQYAQSADVLTLTHRDYQPRELRRQEALLWSLQLIRFEPNMGAPTGVTATVGAAGSNVYDYQVVAISTNNNEESLPGSVTSSAVNIIDIGVTSYTATTSVSYGGRGGGSSYQTNTYYRLQVEATSHGLQTGDMVLFQGIVGMLELNGQRYRVERIDADNFYVKGPPDVNKWNAYVSGGTVTPTSKTLSAAAVPTTAAPNVISWNPVENAFEYHVFRSDANSGIYGFIGVSRSNTFSDDNVLPDTEDTPRVPRDPFVGEGNYPSVCGYFQQRRLYGSTDIAKETVWCSAVADYNNLSTRSPVRDNDAIVFSMVGNRVHEVRHLIDIGQLVILTSGGEWIAHGSSEGALTPTDINLKQYGHNGSSRIQPLVVTNTMLYVQARGSIVRDFRYQVESDGYAGRDLSIFAPHLFDGRTIVDWAYQEIPHSVVWAIRDDGALLGLTYVRDHEVWGWHRHDTDGLFESCCVVPEGGEDALYTIVKREINGNTVRYIERMHSRSINDVASDAFFVDSGVSYDGRNTAAVTQTLTGSSWTSDDTLTLTASASVMSASDVGKIIRLTLGDEIIRCTVTAFTSSYILSVRPNRTVPVSMRSVAISTWARGITTLTGLDHLEGKSVSVLADGNVISDGASEPFYVVSGGEIELPFHAVIAHVGLPITADIETLDIDIPQGETLVTKKKIVSKVTLTLDQSRGGWVGPDADHLTEFKQRELENWDEPVALHTGPEEIRIQSTWNQNGRIFVRQTDPLPITILAAIPTIQVGGSV